MARLNYSEFKAGVNWAAVVNLCPPDPRLLVYGNEAVRRLLPKGPWVGTIKEYTLCTSNAMITWPRFIETIEASWLCKTPMTLRSGWFETLQNSYGLLDENSSVGYQVIDKVARDGFVQFSDIVVPRKIAIRTLAAADVGQSVLLQGYDENGNWIRIGAQNGEYVTQGAQFVVSQSIFNPPGMLAVQKANTVGPVQAWSVDQAFPSGPTATLAADPTAVAIALWDPDDTLPDYRRSLVPNLQNTGNCPTGNCGATPQVTVRAKLRFVPVKKDSDWFIIANLPAIKEEVQAIVKGERGLVQESEAHEARAVRLLEEELQSYQGHGVVQPFKVDQASAWGAGSIENYTNAYDIPVLTR